MRTALSVLAAGHPRTGCTLQKGLTSSVVQWSRGLAQGPNDAEPSADSAGKQESQRQPKKSRTGGDMTDDGQVKTPNLSKNSSTQEFFDNRGKEVEERSAAEKKAP